ncbi:MAG: hypothetical protein ABIQ31_16080 [Ferruginibacter sp.]
MNFGFNDLEKRTLVNCHVKILFYQSVYSQGPFANPRKILKQMKDAWSKELSKKKKREQSIGNIIKNEMLPKDPLPKDTVSVNLTDYEIIDQSFARKELELEIIKRELKKIPKDEIVTYDMKINTIDLRFKIWFDNLSTQYIHPEEFYEAEILQCKYYIIRGKPLD